MPELTQDQKKIALDRKWKALTVEERGQFEMLASRDLERYRRDLERYSKEVERQRWDLKRYRLEVARVREGGSV